MTKLYLKNDPRVDAEEVQQYFYHSDHLGSAQLVTDCDGNEYQRIEYTPYGETWIERTDNNGVDYLPYRFTGKELDEETGLYYYGARYLDPKYSTWISTDPALGEYIPQAPVNDEARKHNQNLPGMGGIFNHINNNLYHYAANNPVRYIDPDGRDHGDYDVIDDTVKGFTLAYDVYTKTTLDNFPNIYTKNFENFVNENSLFWAYAAGAGALAGLGYGLYNSVSWVNDLVNLCINDINSKNRMLKNSGIDITKLKINIYDRASSISNEIVFKGSSFNSERLKLNISETMNIHIDDEKTFSIRLNCLIDFYFSNCKEKSQIKFYNAKIFFRIKS